jgi:predicted porin
MNETPTFLETTPMQTKTTALKAIVPALFASLACTAFAQSNVTLSGALDLAVTHGSGSIASKNQLDANDYGASRITLKGTEALGGGLKAGFWIESGFNAQNGSAQFTNTNNQPTGGIGGGGLTWNRRSHVSLGGDWGEIRIGRDFDPQYMNLADFDPFDVGGSGAIQAINSAITGPTLVRASNSISYLYGHGFNVAAVGNGPQGFSGSGFQFHAMYYLGNNASSSKTPNDGNGYGLRAVYATGKFTVAGAVSRTRYAAGDVRQDNAGIGYDFGWAHVMGEYSWDRNGAISARGWLAGARVPLRVGSLRVAYSRYGTDAAGNPTAKKFALGYLYPMSKRTTLYTAVAHVTNEGPSAQALNGAVTAPGRPSSGFDVGMLHTF